MNQKLKKLLTNWKVILLLVFLVFSIAAINPSFNAKGVSISHIAINSSAHIAGMNSPDPNTAPRNREVITSMLGKKINDLDDFASILDEINLMEPYDTVRIVTNKQTYILDLLPEIDIITLPELETILSNVTEEVYDEASETLVNVTVEREITVNKTVENIIGVQEIGIQVREVAGSNIRKGLDLAGGTRVILKPTEEISFEDFDILLLSLKQRLNIYGLSDIKVTETIDLAGVRYILVEIPGANQEEVKSLVSQQGKFEAKIGNDIVFSGGQDIRTVMRTADRSGIDPRHGCNSQQNGTWVCRFYFGIVLSTEAAERQARVTDRLTVLTVDEQGNPLPRDNQYLSEQLDFYLDDSFIESLNIGADLKGRAVTDIQITGSGSGRNQEEARLDALNEMKRLQTILITGSLPVTLEIIKTDTISPSLGQEFLNNAILVGIVALVAVMLIIFLVFKKLIVVLSIGFTLIAELILILGFAAIIGWNLDLASIAGIIIAIGTGVDHLIIISDETLKKGVDSLTWLQKIKRAFSIIMVAFFTTAAAMIPLIFAGAGLLMGFAITTLSGLMLGVFIARPAYSAALEILMK
ncbi:MAG: MMPL family transporter [Candidatus Woesearchaeota archaeon]